MQKHKAKKSLGQNFLKSLPALNKIIEAGEVVPTDTVIEIGPGKGALTEKLLEKAGKVIAIEKDYELLEILQEKFATEIKADKLILLNEDILEFDASAYSLKPSAYKIIANIPYNITGAILKKFLTQNNQPERMVLMVQKEVAERIVARDGKESLLSISVKAYGEPKMVMKVQARYFSPAPKVDSAVISVKNISRHFFVKNGVAEEKFWEIVKLGFSHKRKKLSGNLKKALSGTKIVQKPEITALLAKRAEDLTLDEWLCLIQL